MRYNRRATTDCPTLWHGILNRQNTGSDRLIRVVNWNIARRRRPLAELLAMDADVALLQEVGSGFATSLSEGMDTGSRRHWDSYTWAAVYPDDRFRSWCNRWPMVVRLSDRVEVEWFDQVGPEHDPRENEFSVSDVGLIAAARVTPKDQGAGEPFIAVSMYALWDPTDGATRTARSITADLAALIERKIPFSDRMLAAGDLNDWYGAGAYNDVRSMDPVETVSDRFDYLYRTYCEGDRYTVVIHRPNGNAFRIERRRWKTLWGARRWVGRNMDANADLRRRITSGETRLEPEMWTRMRSLGLEFMGPQYPNGRQADADQQLDYVFASQGFHESVTTRALNSVDEWGSSDHCRILIDVAG